MVDKLNMSIEMVRNGPQAQYDPRDGLDEVK